MRNTWLRNNGLAALVLMVGVAPFLLGGKTVKRGPGGASEGSIAATMNGNSLTDATLPHIYNLGSLADPPSYTKVYFSATGSGGWWPAGNDSTGDGSPLHPFLTIDKCIDLVAAGYVECVLDPQDTWDTQAEFGRSDAEVASDAFTFSLVPSCDLEDEFCSIVSGGDYTGNLKPTLDFSAFTANPTSAHFQHAGGAANTWVAFQNLSFINVNPTHTRNGDFFRINGGEMDLLCLNCDIRGLQGSNNQFRTSHSGDAENPRFVCINCTCETRDSTGRMAVANDSGTATLDVVEAGDGTCPAGGDCIQGVNWTTQGFIGANSDVVLEGFGATDGGYTVLSVSATDLQLTTTALTAASGDGDEQVTEGYTTQCISQAGADNILLIGGTWSSNNPDQGASFAAAPNLIQINSSSQDAEHVILGAKIIDRQPPATLTADHRAAVLPAVNNNRILTLTIARTAFIGWSGGTDGTNRSVVLFPKTAGTTTNGTLRTYQYRNSIEDSAGWMYNANWGGSGTTAAHWMGCVATDTFDELIFRFTDTTGCSAVNFTGVDLYYDDTADPSFQIGGGAAQYDTDDDFVAGSASQGCNGGAGFSWGHPSDGTSVNSSTSPFDGSARSGVCTQAACREACTAELPSAARSWSILYIPKSVLGKKVTGYVGTLGEAVNIGQ